MQQLVTSLMFVGDHCGNAEQAIELYVSAFERSRIIAIDRYGAEDAPERGLRQARFEIAGRQLSAMDSAMPHQFGFTPAVSLTVEFDDHAELDAAWERLADGGTVLMPLQAYPFASRFGWLNDRFGVSWQLLATV